MQLVNYINNNKGGVHIKYLAISLIKYYQRIAPEGLRSACRFEPSCSNYTILAIQKYGFFKGIRMGMHRIFRCHYPNGGIDFP
jgi:putative membrane protein insertion efficiency factor